LSVYPAGVKQYFRSELNSTDGKVTVINNPCVVKSISAAPVHDYTVGFTAGSSCSLKVYDGESLIINMAGSAYAQFLVTNTSILIPGDGLRIKNRLDLECNVYYDASNLYPSEPKPKHVNIKIDYQ
jgi:hypothetical protein